MSKKKYISFSELYTADFELTDIFAMRQKWYKGMTFVMDHPRKSSALIYLNGCVGEYKSSGAETVYAARKSLVCLPSDSEYTVLNADCGLDTPDAYLVEFNILRDGEMLTISDAPFVIAGVNSYLAAELMCETVEAYEATVYSPAAVKAAVYKLISFLGKESIREYNKKFRAIEVGIELLESDIMGERSIEQIADICAVSPGSFRRLFREYSGKSPLEYRIDLKIGMAKNMLIGSNISVENIADSLRFESSAYFCRLFKKKTGMTPSEYRSKEK